MGHVAKLLHEHDGATSVEYSVMLALILLVAISAIGTLGATSGGMWGNIATQINDFFTPGG